MKFRTSIVSVFAIVTLVLSACGGGSGTSNTATGTTTGGTGSTTQAKVGLVGTLAMATGGRMANRYASSGTSRKTGTTPANQIIVIAVDANGNSFTTMSDRSGDFEFDDDDGLISGTAYGLVFIDTSTLQVIGSLITGNGDAGMLALDGNTTLEEIVINPASGGASIAGEVTVDGTAATPNIVDGDSLDGDSDGIITQNEITTAQVNAATTSGDTAIESMSVVTFFGDVNTYVIERQDNDHGWNNNLCWLANPGDPSYPSTCTDTDYENDPMIEMTNRTGDIEVVVAAQVEGPNGDIVNASKRMELTYYSQEVADPEHPLVGLVQNTWNNGYANGAQADINTTATNWGNTANVTGEFYSPYLDAELSSLPSEDYDQQMGIWGWSDYRFVDVVNEQMVTGEKAKNDQGQIEIDWGGFALPLNLPLNTDVNISESRMEDFGSGPITISKNQVLRVKLAKNANGTPALVTESGTGGIQLPVIQINITGIDWSVSDGTSVLFDSNDDIMSIDSQYQPVAQNIIEQSNGPDCFFIIAKYGAEGDDFDEDCDTTSDWQQAFTDKQFGEITLDAAGNVSSVTDRTPTFITDNGEGMPESDSAGTTFADAGSWMGYMVANQNDLDHVFEPFDFGDTSEGFGGGNEFWSWVEWPHEGSPLTPQPFATKVDSTETIFQMNEIPGPNGNITVNNLHYMSTGTGGAQFYLDLRVWNSENSTESSILSSPVVAMTLDSNSGTAVDTLAATSDEQVIDISADFAALPASGSSAWTEIWESFEDPDGDDTFELFETSWVTVWVVMDVDLDGNGVIDIAEGRQQHPVDGYRVINPVAINP